MDPTTKKERLRILRANAKIAGELVNNALQEIKNCKNVDLVFDDEALAGKTVIKLCDNENSTFTFPGHVRLVTDEEKPRLQSRINKIFIESCENCILNLDHKLISQHVEMSHCENVIINVNQPLLTLQIDLCMGVVVNYSENLFCDNTKVIHAGVEQLKIVTSDGLELETGFSAEVQGQVMNVRPTEMQFMTKMINGNFKTVRVARAEGHLVPTEIAPDTTQDQDEDVNARNNLDDNDNDI